jgi:hypothetical protein
VASIAFAALAMAVALGQCSDAQAAGPYYSPAEATQSEARGIGIGACRDQNSAEILMDRVANGLLGAQALVVGTTCSAIQPFVTDPAERATMPVAVGPVSDRDGDDWVVYAVPTPEGVRYLLVLFYAAEGGFGPGV